MRRRVLGAAVQSWIPRCLPCCSHFAVQHQRSLLCPGALGSARSGLPLKQVRPAKAEHSRKCIYLKQGLNNIPST